MNKEQKRYRQINIMESFKMGKKPKVDAEVTNVEANLRNLMAAAAERRLEVNRTQSNIGKSDFHQFQAGTSAQPKISFEKFQDPEIEENCLPSSAEIFEDSSDLFGSSTELYPGTPVIEHCSSYESTEAAVINSQSSSTHSAELFVEEYESQVDSKLDDEKDSVEEQAEMSLLNRIPDCSIPLPKLEPLENHSIMFSPHVRPQDAPRPFPSSYRDIWDTDHVRMPCSSQSKYPVEENGHKEIRSRWDLICRSLNRRIRSSQDLEEAIMIYNSQYRDRWNFEGLHLFFNTCFTEEEREHFFDDILPRMINMALNLPNICTQPIPLLKKERDHYVTMSQKQIACLLLNAFFCTFPRRNAPSRYQNKQWTSEYYNYPEINFNRLFSSARKNRVYCCLEKLKCLINYFRRVTFKEPTGTVTFHRQYLKELPRWQESTRGLRTVIIKSSGVIETEGHGMLQVDFANKLVGGGVLRQGCVQEEIRFVICPDLIVSRLFVECLGPNEVLIVTGVEQYNKYNGYSDDFKWEGNYQDHTPRDAWGRMCTEVIAMDAVRFQNTVEQFKPIFIERELNKAYCGFYNDAYPPHLSAVATGNWGCGAFKGDPHLKFLIQLMAASQAGRDMVYFTFGNKDLKCNLKKIYNYVIEKNIAVGDLWRILMSYCKNIKIHKKEIFPKMYDYLYSVCNVDVDSQESLTKTKCELTDSDKIAMERLIECINDDCSTDIDDFQTNDPG